MELRNMNEIINEKISKEHKIITKCIFQGLTISQIAKKLDCSQSTVSNRMAVLFAKYNAKTRFEFILGVLGEIVRTNKVTLENNKIQMKEMQKQMDLMYTILKNIILNKNDNEKFEFWIKKAKDKLL